MGVIEAQPALVFGFESDTRYRDNDRHGYELFGSQAYTDRLIYGAVWIRGTNFKRMLELVDASTTKSAVGIERMKEYARSKGYALTASTVFDKRARGLPVRERHSCVLQSSSSQAEL